MPEEIELNTEDIDERVHEAVERKSDWLLKAIALTTAFLATIAAVAALRAGATVNEALIVKSEASRLQSEAADQWAYYQSKGIKSAVQEASRAAWLAAGKEPPANLDAAMKQFWNEQGEIEKIARAKERERDRKSAEGDRLFEQHHRYAISVAIFQMAIALGAVAALTRLLLVWFGSLILGFGGTALFLATWLQ
jgi:hypothetical protein